MVVKKTDKKVTGKVAKTVKKSATRTKVKTSVVKKTKDDTSQKVRIKRNFIQTVGRRKSAIARLRLVRQGNGKIIINEKELKDYFPYQLWRDTVTEPLPLVGLDKVVDISVKVVGGGYRGQSEAIRLALARALLEHNSDWRPILRKMGWLTRDSRVKERKKPGLKRARRAPQWQKR